MGLMLEVEDCIVGIVFGVLLVALSGKWFKLSFAKTALMIIIPIYIILMVIDIFSEFGDMSRHPLLVGGSIVHSIFDIVLCVFLFAFFINFALPGLAAVKPFLTNMTFIYWLGIVEAISHAVWMVATFMNPM